MFGLMVEDLLVASRRWLEESNPEELSDVQSLDRPVIAFSDEMMNDLAAIKRFLFQNMYRHYRVKRMRTKAVRIVQDLFEIFLSDPGVLPDDWRQAARSAETESDRARIVADYIAGMTDRFALEEHRTLTDPFSRA